MAVLGKRKKASLAAVITVALLTPAAASEIGKAERVISGAEQAAPATTDWQEVTLGDFFILNQTLRTDKDGRLHVRFADNTTLTLGPATTMTLDKFVYDPNTGSAEMALNLTKGIARVVGWQATKFKPATIKTKTATVGIRGGIGLFQVDGDGTSTATLVFGEMSMVGPDGKERRSTTSDSTFITAPDGAIDGPFLSDDRSLMRQTHMFERPADRPASLSEAQIKEQLEQAGLGTTALRDQIDVSDGDRFGIYHPPVAGLGSNTPSGKSGGSGSDPGRDTQPTPEPGCETEVTTICLDPLVDATGDTGGQVN